MFSRIARALLHGLFCPVRQTDCSGLPSNSPGACLQPLSLLIVSSSLLQIFPFPLFLSALIAVSPKSSWGSGRGQGFCGPLYLSTRPAAGSEREVLEEITCWGTWYSSTAQGSVAHSPAAGGNPWPTQQRLGLCWLCWRYPHLGWGHVAGGKGTSRGTVPWPSLYHPRSGGHGPKSCKETGFSPFTPFSNLQLAAGFVSAPVERDRLCLSSACATPHQPTFSGHFLPEQSLWCKLLTPSCWWSSTTSALLPFTFKMLFSSRASCSSCLLLASFSARSLMMVSSNVWHCKIAQGWQQPHEQHVP